MIVPHRLGKHPLPSTKRTINQLRRHLMRTLLVPFSAAVLILTGCSGSLSSPTSTPGTISLKGLHGLVHGGQQPVAYSSIQIYQAGSTGYGTGARALLTPAVLTDINGNFNITQTYSCTSGTQVYITATGGQPLTGTTNSALSLIAGLGLCDNLGPSTYTNINEITTVGTVWALAPFMNGVNSGAPSTNAAGLASAFADVNTFVNTANGFPYTSTTGVTLPSAEINTIADSIAACVNTAGASSTGCSNLFSAAPNANNSLPSDTITAAINIARNPSRNVSAIISNASGYAVFAPTIPSANDLTLAVTYTGSGLSAPSALAVDSSGNIWVTNATGNSVTEVTHTGTVLSGASGYTPAGLSSPSAIAFDLSGHAWITNAGTSTSSLSELSTSGANVGSSPFSGGGLSTPTGIAFDAAGNSWISNSGNSKVSEFSSTGSALSGSGYTVSGLNAPVGVAVNPH
jgi:hypothetical protein